MAKKYQPSGYYIINIDASNKTSGTPFTPETDDEKLLNEILADVKVNKPIYLVVEDPNGALWCGVPHMRGAIITLSVGSIGSSSQLVIESDGEQLTVTVVDE